VERFGVAGEGERQRKGLETVFTLPLQGARKIGCLFHCVICSYKDRSEQRLGHFLEDFHHNRWEECQKNCQQGAKTGGYPEQKGFWGTDMSAKWLQKAEKTKNFLIFQKKLEKKG